MSKYTLSIKPVSGKEDIINELYINHATYHVGDSGLDLFCLEDFDVYPGHTVFIKTGICCEMLKYNSLANSYNLNVSYYLYPRSSISKTKLRLANSVGIIDAGYRGEIIIALDNISNKLELIKKGMRLAQICAPDLEPFNYRLTDKLSDSSRGSGGFGSTGK